MDALAAAAFAKVGRSPSSPPPPSARALLHAVPDPERGPYTVSCVRAAAADAGMMLFRKGHAPRGEPWRFYVAEPVAEALLPWTGSEARAAEEGWRSREMASDVLLAAVAGAEFWGRGRAVALPDPAKDLEGYAAARAPSGADAGGPGGGGDRDALGGAAATGGTRRWSASGDRGSWAGVGPGTASATAP